MKLTRRKIAEAEKMLTVNGIDEDEAENVLQMLGQILFNTELYSAEEETALVTIEPVSKESQTETPCSYIITQFELPAYGIIEANALPDDFKRIASSKILSKSNDPVTEIKDMLTQQGYQVKVRPHKIYNVSESDFASKYNNGSDTLSDLKKSELPLMHN